MTRAEYAQVMAFVAACWPHWQPTPETVAAGERLLIDLPQDAVLAAVEQSSLTDGFAPGAGQIRSRALALLNPTPDGDQAWSEVLEQIARQGWCGTPSWSHEAVEATVNAFGWHTLCESTNVVADRAHFLKLYETARHRVTHAGATLPSVAAVTARVAELTAAGTPPIRSLEE